jgi:hypothetical protein
MSIDERIERLTAVVESLAGSVVAHDNQIEGLIAVAEKQAAAMANLERRWEAYLNTLPRQ